MLFRFRSLILILIVAAGFIVPDLIAPSPTVWMLIAGTIAHHGWLSMQAASFIPGAIALTLTVLAALIRTWATAYLGADIVFSPKIHTHAVVAAGPYRYVRNPLYLGLEIHFIALTLLMSLYGAIFTVITVTLLLALLTRSEESRLITTPGYAEYAARVPRLIPTLRPRTAQSPAQPQWGRAFLGEIYYWGVAISFAVFLTQYDTHSIIRGVLLSLGASFIIRAIFFKRGAADIA